MVLGLDTRLILLGLCLGLSSIWLNQFSPAVQLSKLSWASTFHRAVNATPFFAGVEPDKPQEPPPIHVLSPRHQQEAKRAAARASQVEEARLHAPVYFLAGAEDTGSAIARVTHELTEHISPKALLIVSTSSAAPTVELSRGTSLPFSVDDVHAALRETDVNVRWTESESTTVFDGMKHSTPSLSLVLPESLPHSQALEVGRTLHRFRERGVAFLIQSPTVEPLAKVVDAMTHYTSTDRHRTASAYSSPLLSLAAGAADEAEGEVLMQTPLLLRFGHVEDHGDDVL